MRTLIAAQRTHFGRVSYELDKLRYDAHTRNPTPKHAGPATTTVPGPFSCPEAAVSDIRWPDGTAAPDGTEAREPDVTYDGKTMAARLLKPGPPGDRPDPRLEGRWRPAA